MNVNSYTHSKTGNVLFTIDQAINYFTVDNFENLYTVDKNNTIRIYDQNGQLLHSANFNISGKLSSIDPSDPMKIYIFYKNVNKVIIADNQLNIIRIIDFQNKLLHYSSGCRTDNGKILVFDSGDQKLKAFNNNLQAEFESKNFYTFAKKSIDPVQIEYFNGMIYVNDPLNGIHIFDRFGTYLQTIDVKFIDNFHFNDNNIYYTKNGRLFAYDLKESLEISMDSLSCPNHDNLRQVILKHMKIYCLSEFRLKVMNIN